MRILLVDDEPMVLRALYRTILSRWPSWEIVTADSGQRAVELLDQRPFDLLMTDMQMPGLDGSAVLKACQRLQPCAIRLVLSGHAPLQRILETEGSYHRFLTKPIEPKRQLDILASLNLEDLDSERLYTRNLVAGLERIPSLPRHVATLQNLLDQPDLVLGEVAEVVAEDIGLATVLLRLVNSAYLATGRPITDLRQAVEFLGLSHLRELIQHRSQRMAATEGNPEGLDLEAVWAHSREVASLASQWILKATGDAALAAETYSIGLLHDVGMVVLAITPSYNYREVLQHGLAPGQCILDLEREWLGTDHGMVGATLLNLWALPASFSTVIREHHVRELREHSSLSSLAIHCAHFRSEHHHHPDQFPGFADLEDPSPPTTQPSTPEDYWERSRAAWRRAKGETP